MPRLLGVDIPNNKKVPYALTSIFGLGLYRAQLICEKCGIDENKRAYELSEDEVARLTGFIDQSFVVEGNLKREVQANIQRLKEIQAYRGLRHIRSLPCRGQRTKTNSRTRKGKKKTVANKKIARK
ncbi:MAG: 30S ribosomal protein S13 [Planctomycetota bacterium]|jgi:small subunit ribosomal protein S13|nr:30S ribosomal protein S13 [Planctomycetota bacterium]